MTGATLSRRDLLRIAGAAAAAASVGAGCTDSETVAPAVLAGPFFTPAMRDAANGLADYVLPPDDQPGGSALGVVDYLDRFFSAFEGAAGSTPPVFAGGPYSGRTPFANDDGTPSTNFPPNAFATFLAMDRVTEAAIRLMIYGSDGVEGGGPNDDAGYKVVGLRDLVKKGLTDAIASTDQPLPTADYPTKKTVFLGLDKDFQDAWIDLVCQAAFAPPEYGGNPNLAGWKMIHFEGDSMPLGYSQYDATTSSYRERADAPLTGPNPGPDSEPMDGDTEDFIRFVAIAAGGKAFS